jgi:hypothetical protein
MPIVNSSVLNKLFPPQWPYKEFDVVKANGEPGTDGQVTDADIDLMLQKGQYAKVERLLKKLRENGPVIENYKNYEAITIKYLRQSLKDSTIIEVKKPLPGRTEKHLNGEHANSTESIIIREPALRIKKPDGYSAPFTRSKYFDGQRLTERDFSEEQNYHNSKKDLIRKLTPVKDRFDILQNITWPAGCWQRFYLGVDDEGNTLAYLEGNCHVESGVLKAALKQLSRDPKINYKIELIEDGEVRQVLRITSKK